MDDLISRQAAIDAIDKALNRTFIEPCGEMILKDLPSVQPDHNADVSKKAEGDCISRQAVVKFFNDWISCLDENCHHQSVADMAIIKNDFKNLPSAQPERKKGYWLRYGEDGYPNNEDTVFWQCDQCLEQYTGRAKKIPNFCPNCGADMRKENES